MCAQRGSVTDEPDVAEWVTGRCVSGIVSLLEPVLCRPTVLILALARRGRSLARMSSAEGVARHELEQGSVDACNCVAQLEADRFASSAQYLVGGFTEDEQPRH